MIIKVKINLLKDKNTRKFYRKTKDIYASAAASLFNLTPQECSEYWDDGKPNPNGKKIRKFMKELVCGFMLKHKDYGKEMLLSALDNYSEIKDILQSGRR